jgi:hypothetical protein
VIKIPADQESSPRKGRPKAKKFLDEDVTSTDDSKVAFAKRLHRELLKKGWNQSRLVSEMNNIAPPDIVLNRHLPSTWLNAKHLPDSLNMSLIAKALKVPMKTLVPDAMIEANTYKSRRREESGDFSPASMAMTGSDKARIKLDIELPAIVALQILKLVQENTQKELDV